MSAPPQREIVYCHQCENEWYRDENGLQCPECQSEFIEIVEGGNDPRQQQQRQEADSAAEAQHQHPLHDHDPWNAPDPDEEDIEHLRWRREPWDGGGPQRYRATFNRSVDLGGGAGGAAGGGLMGMIGNMVNGLLQQQREQQHQGQQHGHEDPARNQASSPPGSPDRGSDGPQQTRPGTYTRHITGPGYSFTMTASSGSGPRTSALLSPRNANSPQPFNAQPQDMDDLMQQMFSNIGAFPPLPHQGNHQGHNHQGHPHAQAQPNPLLHLLNTLTIPASGGIHGDAVYSQEALDRIVTQLMEQHSSGNAPGPASAAAIKSLPSRALAASEAGDCSICMETVPAGESVTVLPCEHWFHGECIRAWLAEHDTCPHCRMGIMPREGEGVREWGEEARNGVREGRGVAGGDPGAGAAGGSGSGGSAGVFGRMRDAFGGGGGGSA